MDIKKFSKKVIETFSAKDISKEIILERKPTNEVLEIKSGFIIVDVDIVVIRKIKENNVGIFLYRGKELLAKHFILDFFKEKLSIELYQEVYDGKETYDYGFKLSKENN